jgi:hypothetical protein
MSDFRLAAITPLYIQESERFQKAFTTIKNGLTEILKPDEELVLYYINGPEIIRVYHIQVASDTLLVFSGQDSSGNAAYGVTNVREVNLVFKKLKLGDKKQRTPIGFSTTSTETAPEG